MADKFNGLRIELRPHIGVMGTAVGPVEIEHDQWIVVAHTANANVKHLGYLPKRENAKLLYLSGANDGIPPAFLDEIQRQCDELASKKRLGIVEEVPNDGA